MRCASPGKLACSKQESSADKAKNVKTGSLLAPRFALQNSGSKEFAESPRNTGLPQLLRRTVLLGGVVMSGFTMRISAALVMLPRMA